MHPPTTAAGAVVNAIERIFRDKLNAVRYNSDSVVCVLRTPTCEQIKTINEKT